MTKHNIISLYKKEILDVIRDKKTIIMMILIPMFLYPCIMLGSLFVMTSFINQIDDQTYKIAVIDIDDSVITKMEQQKTEEDKISLFNIINVNNENEAIKRISQKEIDGYILQKNTESKKEFVLGYSASDTRSSSAVGLIQDTLDEYEQELSTKMLKEKQEDPDLILNPIETQAKNVASQEKSMGALVGLIVPFMLITSILMGAIYPAIDVTAGERERGTLETLMTLPVKNIDIMVSKFLSVSTIAIASALLNILSMSFVSFYIYDVIKTNGQKVNNIHLLSFIPALIVVVICILIFALFTSSVCLSVCLFAKSFKEANNLSTPILMVFMILSLGAVLPDIELSMKTAFIPVLNISLLIKKVFLLEYDYTLILIVLVSTIIYTVIAVILMSRLFDSENVLFGEEIKGVTIFEKRKYMKNNQIPGYGDVILMFGFLLLCILYLSNLFMNLGFGIWGTALFQLVIIAIPILYAWYMKADFKKLFSLKISKIRFLMGGIVLWLGTWIFEQVIVVTLVQFFPSLNKTAEAISGMVTNNSFPAAFFVVAFTPAIAEEIAFRGFLYGTLKQRMKPFVAIVISALLFGAYHLNWLQFIGAFLLGMAMAYAVYRSESIFVSMVIHFINNGVAVVFQFYPKLLSKIPIISKANYTLKDTVILLILSIILMIAGFLLLAKRKKQIAKKATK